MEKTLFLINSITCCRLYVLKLLQKSTSFGADSLLSVSLSKVNYHSNKIGSRLPVIILLLFVYVPGNSQTCTGQVSSFPYHENFESGFGLWTQATDDHFDWTRQSGGTPNAGTGPTEAAEGSYYLYTNSGPNHPWLNSGVISPCFDLTGKGGGIFTFSYHMNGNTMGWLELFASTNNGSTWNKIWGAGGTGYGTRWIQQNVDVSQYAGQKVQFKFSVTMNSDPTSDIAIDEISLKAIALYQAPVLSNENYILTRTYQTPLSSSNFKVNADVIEEVTYFDGLGRPKQHVAIKASPEGEKDIVTHIEYDQFGRTAKSWLPIYEPNGNLGSYRGDVSANSRQYYLNKFPDDFGLINEQEVNSYSETIFESSPLNRVLKQGAPGKTWEANLNSNNDHTIKFSYETNRDQEVRLYRVNLDANFTPSLINISNEFYPASQLYKTITRDENWTIGKNHTVEEFKDKQGQVILKRNYADIDLNGNGDTNDLDEKEVPHDTYYIYDDYGNLTFVLPPKAEPTETNVALSTEKLNNLCYQYKYDNRNRLIEKKISGKDPEYIIYNKLDQPVMTQDGNQRGKSQKEWLFSKYDAFGRITFTGKAHDNRTREIIQAEADAYTGTLWSERGPQSTLAGSIIYYSNQGYPNTTITEILTVNYYDDYNFPGVLEGISMDTESWGIPLASNVKGLHTFTQSKVLETSLYVRTAIRYDVKGRQTWSRSMNDYLGTSQFSALKLDFTGKVTDSYNSHRKNEGTALVYIDHFTYDHLGRFKKHGQVLRDYGFPIEIIADNTYDELGQLVGKGVGNLQGKNRLQNISYEYNIRGWLKNINDPTNLGNNLFGFEINYNYPKAGADALYNGNISETHWNTKSENTTGNLVSNHYKYSYDVLNRITGAIDNTGNYNLGNVTYDKMGNILSLQRQGHLNANATLFGNMDDLNYGYEVNGNKLLSVNDAGNGTFGFKNGSTAQNQYQYDANGNLTSDANKGITAISYNHLNLTKKVTIGGQNIDYTYDATGVKLKKEIPGKVTEYAGNFVYEKIGTGVNVLQFFNHPEGYVSYDGVLFNYVYNYKDHLGNVRLTYADLNNNGTIEPSSEILHEKNYYPFGLQHKGYNNVVNGTENNYKTFQGKEEENELGRNTYDFGWRDFDPAIARWSNIDPLAERYITNSPYVFTANNPIFNREIDGRYFEGRDERRADRLERRADRRAEKLSNKADRLEAKGKSAGDLRERAGELTQSANDIRDMRGDGSTQYRYASANGIEAKNLGIKGQPSTAGTGVNDKGDNVVTMFTGSNTGQKLHETRHGGQHSRGQVNAITQTSSIDAEISAYRAEYSWSGSLSARTLDASTVNIADIQGRTNILNRTLLDNGNYPIGVQTTNVSNISQITRGLINNMVEVGNGSITGGTNYLLWIYALLK